MVALASLVAAGIAGCVALVGVLTLALQFLARRGQPAEPERDLRRYASAPHAEGDH